MKIRWNKAVFVRTTDDESVVWMPRNGGCTILTGAVQFLKEINTEWCNVEDIPKRIADRYDVCISQAKRDFGFILGELANQGFLDIDYDSQSDYWELDLNIYTHAASSDENDYCPLGEFCQGRNIPSEFHLDLTDSCTERCVHCYVPKEQHHFLSYEMAEKAIREFRELQGFSVHITGGECMLHPDFERVCELCKSLNINIIIFSNLTCCDARRIAFLREINPQFINVSLYSMDPEEHDAITQLPGSWKKTMDTLLACEKAGVHCRIATPLLKINQNAFPELKKFADAHHMHLVPSADIIAQSDHGCGNLASACSVDEMRYVMQANRELFNRYDGVKMPACDAKVCDIGSGRLYLNAQGNYYPCDSMHDYVLGNVRENTFEEIWRGEKLECLRGLKNKDFGACSSCANRPWCKVCPAANFNATRDLFTSPSGHCEFAAAIREVYGKDN